MFNILITSAGRRVSLVKNFQKYSKVFCCDMNPTLSAACQVSDGYFKVPRVTDKNYLEVLFDICKQNDIKIIIPTIDTELEILAKAKEKFLKLAKDIVKIGEFRLDNSEDEELIDVIDVFCEREILFFDPQTGIITPNSRIYLKAMEDIIDAN